MSYLDKLKDPRWQKKRLEIFERDNWRCKYCGNKGNTLNIHHIIYLKSREIWDIPNGFLITVCEKCHDKYANPYNPKFIEKNSDIILNKAGKVLNKYWEKRKSLQYWIN